MKINGLKDRIKNIVLLRSFRLRIFLVLMIVGIIPSLIVRAQILSGYEKRAVDVKVSEVQNQLKIIADHLITYNYLTDQANEVVNAELEQLSNLYDGRVLIINGDFKIIKDSYGISVGRTIISEEVIRCFKGEVTSNYDPAYAFIEMTIPIKETGTNTDQSPEHDMMSKTDKAIKGVMLISVSTDTINTTMDMLSRTAWIIDVILGVLIFALAMGFSRFLTAPFNKVSDAISNVRLGYTDEAIDVPDYKETEHIVAAFNLVLRRMRVLDETRQEFVSNVSHELKTPLTSVKLLADNLLADENAPIEVYRDFMEDITGEIDRENKIITDLLELVKLDKTEGELKIENCLINDVIEKILKRMAPIADQSNVTITFISNRDVNADIDEVKFTLGITNFIENAIKYNKPGGSVIVSLDADHECFTVVIEDTGIGIPEEARENIFERFYRVDKSHSREIGGTGLGLAIARNVVLVHRGRVTVESEPDVGTSFTVEFPLQQSKNV
ncbi:MAG: cell wall metabolism sensor histidine kinase WalK [Lachnospiraceae bacterium]|nr:cell wall metabolism sensor histidine kinase WalK [Lachnospiraceae bacterium]